MSLGAREPCVSPTAFELWSSGLCLFRHVNIQKISSAVALSTNLGAHPSRDRVAWLSRDKDMFLIMCIRAIWRCAAADNPYTWGNVSVRREIKHFLWRLASKPHWDNEFLPLWHLPPCLENGFSPALA